MQNSDVTLDAWRWQDACPSDCHKYILPALIEMLKSLKPKRVLDVGCGNGSQTAALAAAGFHIVGCDVDRPGISIAKQAFPNCEFLNVGVYDDPSTLGELGFDAVISTEVIEHLYKPRELMRFVKRAISPNGHFILSTPYHGYLKNLAISVFDGWDKHFHPWEHGGHIKFFSPQTLTQMLQDEGLKVTDRRFVGRVQFFWKSMILCCAKQ